MAVQPTPESFSTVDSIEWQYSRLQVVPDTEAELVYCVPVPVCVQKFADKDQDVLVGSGGTYMHSAWPAASC